MGPLIADDADASHLVRVCFRVRVRVRVRVSPNPNPNPNPNPTQVRARRAELGREMRAGCNLAGTY